MPVYIDHYFEPLGRMHMSHMIADTLPELHEMADKIGVARKWFQDKASTPHYDVSKGKRELAIKFGAIPVDRKELVRKIRELRGPVPLAKEK
jgi:Protein of unknown function (DUF4031)